MNSSTGRVQSLILLGGGTLLAATCGVLFQSLLAYHFGAGAESDAWFMSLSIYGFLGKFLMLGNVKSLALPVYRRLQDAEPAAAIHLERRLLLWLGVGTGAVSALLVVGAPMLVAALAPGYVGEQRALTITLVRIRTPALAFLAVSTGGLVALEAAHRFGVSVTAQKVAPAVVSLALLALVADRFGMLGVGWAGLAGGVAGGIVALAAMRPLLGRSAAPVSADGRERAASELRDVGRQWLGLSGSNAAAFVGEWTFRVAASLLPVGLFSAVLYGRMVHDLFHAAINDSAQTVSLPRFAAAAAAGDAPERLDGRAPPDRARLVAPELREALLLLSSVTVPVAAFMAMTAPWVVALLFGRGRFLADGMLAPAAISVRLFALAFLVQGMNQTLFSAAFASGRSELVNRVQVVGHLARAVILVPAVFAYSYVGLVGAQVAMNVLVLLLLVGFSPAAWGLRFRGESGVQLRGPLLGIAAGTAMAVLAHWIIQPLLGDPLAVGTAMRAGTLVAGAVGWLLVYGVVTALLDVPPVRWALMRVGRRTALPVLAAFGLVGADASAAQGQEVGGAAVSSSHWSRTALEILEARGAVAVGTSSTGHLSGARVARILAEVPVPWAQAAYGAFDWELGGAGWMGWVAEAQTGGSHAGSGGGAGFGGPAGPGGRVAGSGAWVGGGLRFGTGTSPGFGFVAGEVGSGRAAHRVARGGVGFRTGSWSVQAGRERVQLGGGASGGTVLSAQVPLDGVLLATHQPVGAGPLGTISVTAGVFPMPRYEAVDDPWFGLVRVVAHPARWVSVGLSRAGLVGGHFAGGSVPWDPVAYGPDGASISAGDVLGILLGRVTRFDNQVAALDLRVSAAPLGAPALVYGEVALEDNARSWGDGAVLVGALLAPSSGIPLGIRYEYVGFGPPGDWCAWCDTLPAFWYGHTRFQSGWRVREDLLGHPLGGYGLQHLVGVAVFSADARLHLDLAGGRMRRDRWNLLEAERPGWATWGRALARYRWARGVEVRAEGGWEVGDQGWSTSVIRVSLAALFGG